MNYKSTAIISTLLLIAFLVPYIWKIKAIPMIILLVFGVFLAIYDFVLNTRAKPNLQPQHASYEEEST
jgi:ABC-type transport system involved in cytochrome bd biosynthesis fused ATPase/permease subunit